MIKHLILLKIQNIMDINSMDFLQWSINFFDKKGISWRVKHGIISKKEVAEELHKQIIRKFEKRKVYSQFVDNFRGTDLADTQLISNFGKGFRFL